MRKIPTLFERDWDGDRRYVLDKVVPECEWVVMGGGVATRKYDGTCVMLDDAGAWWARREVKAGKPAPTMFVAVQDDGETGKTVGWEPGAQSPFARFLEEAVTGAPGALAAGTYELIGPKVNGNPEQVPGHVLVRHADAQVLDHAPRDFALLGAWLHAHPYEGVVWHGGPGGAMAKIKKRDFRKP
jgi:hypothetical protein